MGDMTTIGEILEFAIGRETEAVEFYMAMADRAAVIDEFRSENLEFRIGK